MTPPPFHDVACFRRRTFLPPLVEEVDVRAVWFGIREIHLDPHGHWRRIPEDDRLSLAQRRNDVFETAKRFWDESTDVGLVYRINEP